MLPLARRVALAVGTAARRRIRCVVGAVVALGAILGAGAACGRGASEAPASSRPAEPAAAGAGREFQGEAAPDAWVNSIGMRFVRVRAGEFEMGSPRSEPGRLENEGPQRRVRITRPFSLATTEVTVGQMEAFVAATGHVTDAERDAEGGFGIDFATGKVVRRRGITFRDPGFPGFRPGADHPAVLVSWQDAEAFCAWLARVDGRPYRLPTEAEWEYAARAGTSGPYSSGDGPASLRGCANVADASLRRAVPAVPAVEEWDDGFPFLAPVASFPANRFGLHDMHGNVWEWCADWYAADAYAHSATDDPTGPATGSFRTIRGGGWLNPAVQNRSAQRVYFDPSFRYCLLSGFRVACDAP